MGSLSLSALPQSLKMSKPSCRKGFFLISTFFLRSVVSQLALGAGTGPGSCRAFPFRAAQVDWDVCPPELPCCNEYGYCRSREEWGLQNFRDCNGVSNGVKLPDSVLELENALGGDPGPGLGADSDFDKRQLQKVGSGSPAQREKPNFDAFAAGGRVSAAGAGKAEGSLVRPAAAAGWSRSKGSSRRRRPSGNQVSSGSDVGSRKRQESSQGSENSQESQNSQFSSGRQKVERIPAPRNPVQKNPPQTGFPPRINTPVRKFAGTPGNVGNLVAEVFSPSSPTGSQRPREPARRKGPSRPRPSAGRPTFGSRPLRQQSKKASTGQVSGSGKKGVSNKSSSNRSKTTGSSRTKDSSSSSSRRKDVKATDLYPLAGYKNTAGYPMNLNAENCPNYPFCYWNPYAAGAKD